MSTTASILRAAAGIALSVMVGTCAAQTSLWPVATLQPPGLDVPITALADVALAGDVAVTAYAPSATLGYRVYLRLRTAQGWGTPQLLVQGQAGEGEGINVDADANHIAIGLPKSDVTGRVDVFARNGSAWNFQQSLLTPTGVSGGDMPNFGRLVSIRQSLLVISAGTSFSSRFDSYRYDIAALGWIPGGYSYWNPIGPGTVARTDGLRIAACLNVNCIIKVHNGDGIWISEGGPEGSGGIVVDGDWFFHQSATGLAAYRRNGAMWQIRQEFGAVNGFFASEGRLIVRSAVGEPTAVRVYEVDAGGVWQLVGTIPGAYANLLAINAGFALSGTQSFASAGAAGWLPSGIVEGLSDAANSLFATTAVLATNHVWIGSPGYNGDTASGAVWMEPLDGNSQPTPRFIDVPSSPAPYMGFGAAIATDGSRVAVASRHSTPTVLSPLRIRVYSATSMSPIAEVVVPDTPATLWSTAVAVDGDVLALTRSGIQAGVQSADVLVYRDSGGGYSLTQTILLPESAFGNSGRGQTIKLSGDWLLAGRRRYERIAGGDFVDRGEIPDPPGSDEVVYNFQRVGNDPQRLVVAVTYDSSSQRIASVFNRDASDGWVYSGDVLKGSSAAGPCASLAISVGAIVCAGFGDNVLHVAKADALPNSWTVTESAAMPGISSVSSLAMEGSHIAVGAPPKLVVMTLDETIFQSGMD